MTPKEKAQEMIGKMQSISGLKRFAVGYASICVGEIQAALISYGEDSHELQNMDSELRYWDAVRNEIGKL